MEIEIVVRPNVDPRRRQELADSSMIFEDHSKPSNCSDTPIVRTFNQDRYVERLDMYNQSTRKKP